MQLTGKEIIEQGLVTNYIEGGIQQQGVDIRVNRIWKVLDGGHVTNGKTQLGDRMLVEPVNGTYILAPGYYEFEAMEGCVIKDDVVMYLKGRSSMIRNGIVVYSGQFDAGFQTSNMGAFFEVKVGTSKIDHGARIAQTIFTRTSPVTNLYNGQWQKDVQRGS